MKTNHHFLVISFPIQGHINPTLQLAKNLARLGAKVTFTTTVGCLKRLQHALPILDNLSYASFSDGHEEDNNQHSGDLMGYMANFRRAGSKNLANILRESLDKEPVTCLVYSLLLPWAATVARDMHVPSAFLCIQCATAFTIYNRLFNTHDIDDSSSISSSVKIDDLPLFSSTDLPTFVLPGNPMSDFMRPMMQEHIQELEKDPKSLVLLNTFQELEQEAIKALENCKTMNVIAIGPLIPSAFSDGNDSTDKSFGGDLLTTKNDDNKDYLDWLDSKEKGSVVYVAFGSLVVMSKEQRDELLHGLKESKRPFLWVIRSSSSSSDDDDDDDEINGGDDGMIVTWCSQMEVLSHRSIGCFVTHSGWNSSVEGLICGVPSICFPHFADQPTNAKMVEEVWGTGVRARVSGDVVVEREEFKKCLDVAMGEGERGEEIRGNCRKWRGLAIEAVKCGGSSHNNLKRVLEINF